MHRNTTKLLAESTTENKTKRNTYSHVFDVLEGSLQVVHVAHDVVDSVDAVLAQLGAGCHDIHEIRQEGALEVSNINKAQRNITLAI